MIHDDVKGELTRYWKVLSDNTEVDLVGGDLLVIGEFGSNGLCSIKKFRPKLNNGNLRNSVVTDWGVACRSVAPSSTDYAYALEGRYLNLQGKRLRIEFKAATPTQSASHDGRVLDPLDRTVTSTWMADEGP